MAYHVWGDGFNFEGLDKAASYLSRLYFKCTKKHMCFKEKYGTIRYEALWDWLDTPIRQSLFQECLLRAIVKFPEFGEELIEDIIWQYGDRSFLAGVAEAYRILRPQEETEIY